MAMNLDTLTDEELKDLVLKKQLEYIKLCQDDFLAFAQDVWPDFIYRKNEKQNFKNIIFDTCSNLM